MAEKSPKPITRKRKGSSGQFWQPSCLRVYEVVARYGESHEVSKLMRLHVPIYEDVIRRIESLKK